MQTFYIDVYFLINFTVDVLSLYLAVRVTHVKTRLFRLTLAALIGATVALVDAFLYKTPILRIPILIISLIVASFVVSGGLGLRRRLKFILMFFTVQLLLGGAVSFGYSVLDNIMSGLKLESGGSENRGALILALLVLFSIGVIKLLIMIFSDYMGEKNVVVKIRIADTSVEAEALVDSGNLVKDPMNMQPVLFIKRELALKLVPRCILELDSLDLLDQDYRKRIRLVPVTRMDETHVMTGVRADEVIIINGESCESVNLTVVIDKEGGSFGGYDILLPRSVINDAF